MIHNKAIIITGPTASGKSDFAHELACRIQGTIINCDSVQIYRGIENISASPFARRKITSDIGGVPYRLFSVLDLNSQLSVAEYLNFARRQYNDAINTGRTPIFVGGTGYYVNAILNGISPMPDVSDENRMRARKLVETDIVGARKMLPDTFIYTDPQRVARALEVLLETGRHITEFQSAPRVGAVASDAYKILVSPGIDVLRSRIVARIPLMLTGGALAEAQTIIDNNQNPNRAIGAAQLCAYLRGDMNKDECIKNWITKTSQYAKRQRTWFRTQFAADTVIENTPSDTDLDFVMSQFD